MNGKCSVNTESSERGDGSLSNQQLENPSQSKPKSLCGSDDCIDKHVPNSLYVPNGTGWYQSDDDQENRHHSVFQMKFASMWDERG